MAETRLCRFELYERNHGRGKSDKEYSIKLSLSEGAHSSNVLDSALDARHSLNVQPRRCVLVFLFFSLPSARGRLYSPRHTCDPHDSLTDRFTYVLSSIQETHTAPTVQPCHLEVVKTFR